MVDLFDGETAALVAWTAYLVGEQLQSVSPQILPRLHREIDARLLTPNLERDDFWWMGFGERRVNNWNPWVNSNWLTCALLMEEDEDRRAAAVYKILRSLDRFLVPYPRDGGCDEGPGYWSRAGAAVFDNLELLYGATAGNLDEYGDDLVREIGRLRVPRAHRRQVLPQFRGCRCRAQPRPDSGVQLRAAHRRRKDGQPLAPGWPKKPTCCTAGRAPRRISRPAWGGCCRPCSACRRCPRMPSRRWCATCS